MALGRRMPIDGISTFDPQYKQFVCGVYKSEMREVVETERFALVYYCSQANTVLGTRLYVGMGGDKKLYAICEYNKMYKTIGYAYKTDKHMVYANNDKLKGKLDQAYDEQRTKTMKSTETFLVNHDKVLMPTVKEAGIKKCLLAWRMADSISSAARSFSFRLYTGKTEYIFSIEPQNTNIYCGISYNFPFDFGCIPINKCEPGKCVETDQGLVWALKRYTDDQIVLQGCGNDEYFFGRQENRTEIFYFYGQ